MILIFFSLLYTFVSRISNSFELLPLLLKMPQYKTGSHPEILVYTIPHIPHRPHTYILTLYTTRVCAPDSSPIASSLPCWANPDLRSRSYLRVKVSHGLVHRKYTNHAVICFCQRLGLHAGDAWFPVATHTTPISLLPRITMR